WHVKQRIKTVERLENRRSASVVCRFQARCHSQTHPRPQRRPAADVTEKGPEGSSTSYADRPLNPRGKGRGAVGVSGRHLPRPCLAVAASYCGAPRYCICKTYENRLRRNS